MSETSDTEESILACSGDNGESGDVFSGHPKIYVKVAAGETKLCPYCGKVLCKK